MKFATNQSKLGKKSTSASDDSYDEENRREGWTPGWGNALQEREREALPIKKDGKIVRRVVWDRVQEEQDCNDAPAKGQNIYSSNKANYADADHSRKTDSKSESKSKKAKSEHMKSKNIKSDVDSESDGGAGSSDEQLFEFGGEGEYEFVPDFSEDRDTASGAFGEDANGDESEDIESENDDVANAKSKNTEKNREQRKERKEHRLKKEAKLKRLAEGITEEDDDEGEAKGASEFVKGSQKQRRMNILARLAPTELMHYIGKACRGILDSPERALKRRPPEKEALGGLEDNEEDRDYKLLDVFDVITAKDATGNNMFSEQVVEMALLSMLLIFKDILPSYRIRPQDDKNATHSQVQLKKQTKALRDYELGLLGAYQRYLKILSEKAIIGLGPIVLGKKARAHANRTNGTNTQLGLSALRCQCELLQAVPHFNFRSTLLSAVVGRAAQQSGAAHAMACEALVGLFSKDRQGEASLEAARLMATTASHVKFGNIPDTFIRCLFHLRLEVRADEARSLKAKAKRERRKRKRSDDDIATQMAENSAQSDKITAQKLQANCLHEVSLIYFRIIKGHIGFGLLPVALEGLGKIAHLLNIDTMEEVVELMRSLLDKPEGGGALPPAVVQLQCIACALRILHGPGEALGIDLHFFSARLALLMTQLPATFGDWDLVIDCINICSAKRKNERSAPIQNFVRLLIHCAGHQPASLGAVTLLSAAHSLLLRHPRVRARMLAVECGDNKDTGSASGVGNARARTLLFDEDDDVCDMAMQPLQDGRDSLASAAVAHDSVSGGLEDGSWALPLLRCHADPMLAHTVSFLIAKDINPLPLRTEDAKFDPLSVCDRAESALNAVSKSLEKDAHRRASAHNKSKNNGERRNIERKQQSYQDQFDRKWGTFEKTSKKSGATDIQRGLKAFYARRPQTLFELLE